jgi:hypothetical protein
MPKSRGRGRRRQGAKRYEQKATSRPQPTVQKTASPTTTQTAGVQRPTQQVVTSLSHVRGDLIRVGAVTLICLLVLAVCWAILR